MNLGHTFGHAIEAEQGYGVWLHGEAVAAGMVLAAQNAQLTGRMNGEAVQRIITLLRQANLPVRVPEDMGFDAFMRHMLRDKKVKEGRLRLVLPLGIGDAEVVADTSIDILNQVIIGGGAA